MAEKKVYVIKSDQSLKEIQAALGTKGEVKAIAVKDLTQKADFVDWASCVGCKASKLGGPGGER